jgi:hypothetical protein
MDIKVNGRPLAMAVEEGRSLGEVLAAADDLIDRSGSVIVGLSVDGRRVEAEGYVALAERPASGVLRVEIETEDSRSVRVHSLETLLELLALSRQAAEGGETDEEDWASLRSGAQSIHEAFSGLFSADELSFAQLFSELLGRSGALPGAAAREEIVSQATRLQAFFGERLSELKDPVAEMRKAATLFASQAGELGDLPVLLQTGKEDRAMKAVLYFIETFNKVVRVIPELRRSGLDTEAILVDGAALADFYSSFNSVLRGLTEAFEHKDAVLIGDLAEYELLPRMSGFFRAMEEALPKP